MGASLKLLTDLGLVDPNNQTLSKINMSILKDFTDSQIMEAAQYHYANSEFPIKPCNVCEYWRKRTGTTEEDIKARLALKAEHVFNEMIRKANSANDWIVADARAAVTIKALYVSPQRFSRMDKIAEGDDWPRKNFIKRYQEVTGEELSEAVHLFGGFYANTDDPRVTFLGDYNECMQLAAELYQGKRPRLPNDPNVKVLPHAVPKCDQDATPQDESRRYLSAIADLLAKAVKKPDGTGVLLKGEKV